MILLGAKRHESGRRDTYSMTLYFFWAGKSLVTSPNNFLVLEQYYSHVVAEHGQ